MNSCYRLIQWSVIAVKVVSTHMLEGVMGHRHGSSLLQVVIPVKVRHILRRVSIWNTHTHTHTHTHHIALFQPAFQRIILFISRSCSQSSSYQTPVTPDSCWCPLKAKTRSSEEEQRRIIIRREQMNEHWSKNSGDREKETQKCKRPAEPPPSQSSAAHTITSLSTDLNITQ